MVLLPGQQFEHAVFADAELVVRLQHPLQLRLDPGVQHGQQPPAVDLGLDLIVREPIIATSTTVSKLTVNEADHAAAGSSSDAGRFGHSPP